MFQTVNSNTQHNISKHSFVVLSNLVKFSDSRKKAIKENEYNLLYCIVGRLIQLQSKFKTFRFKRAKLSLKKIKFKIINNFV